MVTTHNHIILVYKIDFEANNKILTDRKNKK